MLTERLSRFCCPMLMLLHRQRSIFGKRINARAIATTNNQDQFQPSNLLISLLRYF
jgi:hypothetical protein